MRTEGNPIKARPELGNYKLHRVIMPVYIPNQKGYYKDALTIFKLSLASLIATVNKDETLITIINNNSISEVCEVINYYLSRGEIDQHIHNQVNRGKADAIIAAAKASYEPFITITDADVLFYHGWLEQTFVVFSTFSGSGMVSPFPSPQLALFHTFSTWTSNLFRIKRGSIVDKEELKEFEASLGVKLFKTSHFNHQYFIRRDNVDALIGAGHFVATYRNEVFRKLDYNPVLMGLKGGLRIIDIQVEKLGYSKLSLAKYLVKHMGNSYEDWMAKTNKVVESNMSLAEPREIRGSVMKHLPNNIKKLVYKVMNKII